MTINVEEELRSIRSQISTVQTKKARAQVEYDNAVERANTAKKTLKEEFGVSTTEDAKALLTNLEAELASAIENAKSGLAQAGA